MGDCFSQTFKKFSDGDFAAVRISGVPVIVRCPQGKSWGLFSAPLSETGAIDFIPEYWQQRTIIIIIAKSANRHRKYYIAVCQTVATWTKFLISLWQRFDIFLTTFWWLSLQLANRNATTVGGRVDKLYVGFPTTANSASHSNLYFDWPVAKEAIRKLSKRCQKVFTT